MIYIAYFVNVMIILDCIQMILCFVDDIVICGYSDDIVDLWMILWICECNDDIGLYIVNV